MYIFVFIVLLGIAFTLIALGLYKPEHTELSIIGFVFLFLLSFMIINENITIVTGTNTNSSFNYTKNADNLTLLSSSYETVDNIYSAVELEGTLAHSIGYYMAVASFLGFLGVLLSLRKSKRFQ